jgi:hypothetical protein
MFKHDTETLGILNSLYNHSVRDLEEYGITKYSKYLPNCLYWFKCSNINFGAIHFMFNCLLFFCHV